MGSVTGSESVLDLNPDRLLPADPATRAVARRLYEGVRDLGIVSPHGHVDPRILADDVSFGDPTSLFVAPDHYVTRLLHADGLPLAELGVSEGPLSEARARQIWRSVCERWRVFTGTAVRLWLETELSEIFGVRDRPSVDTADSIFDHVAALLADEAYRPRALYRRFGLEVLATTADPCDDLSVHAALASDPTWSGRVVPIFRPDRYLEAGVAGWPALVEHLGECAGIDTGDFPGYLLALEDRRRYFSDHGATSADHSHFDAGTAALEDGEAARIYRLALSGGANASETTAFRRHMLMVMARMSCEDGLAMTLHCGVRRDHHSPTASEFGSDVGADIPVGIQFTDALRPLLQRFGTSRDFHLVVFTLDETSWSRELAPLAGFYPCLYIGVPWWFLDAPDAIRRFREAVTETAGFSRTSGFVDDTRAFCSIPARHDMSRRVEAGVLARLVVEHRMEEDEAIEIAVDLVSGQPRRVFKL
jgi:glucuronate isomerase